MINNFDKLLENFPFLTYIKYLEEDHLGIVQNSDNQIISMYVYSIIPDENERQFFLKLGDAWWWESNRTIPINIFIKNDFKIYKKYLKSFNKKETEIVSGPLLCLNNLMNKKSKRKQIMLIKK